ncbi:MAG: hypothetical protein HZA17_15465 [Nitrospirae bacterium]|nr:hypothetical protein [Nitrospirota bacterium]
MELRDLSLKDSRKFFAILSAIIIGVGCYRRIRYGSPLDAYGFGTLFIIIFGVLLPSALFPVFKIWMKLAGWIGWLNTRILLVLIYYCIFSPVAFFLKITGKDLLKKKLAKDAATYWDDKKQEEPDMARYEKQF